MCKLQQGKQLKVLKKSAIQTGDYASIKKYRTCKECLIFFTFLSLLTMQVGLAGFSFFPS